MSEDAAAARQRRLLIATNHLSVLRGSEVVALETAEHFAARGWRITAYANWASPPVSDRMEAITGAPVVTDPSMIRPFTHDAAYIQHQVLGLFDYRPCPEDRTATFIAAGRLSRATYLESGGWLHDRVLLDHVFANSELTAEHLALFGDDVPITNFRNAAPEAYFAPFRPKPATPRRVLVVTNHADPALMEAIRILRRSMTVEHLGATGDLWAPLTPDRIGGADLVVSIGKTIPYAIAGRVPVYVYDHFGGPGYLDPATAEAAARANFSGRCCSRTLSGEALAAEIGAHYGAGVAFARDVPQDWIDRYRLPRYLDRMLEAPRADNAQKRRRMLDNPFLIQERMLAAHVRQTYIRERRLVNDIAALEQRVGDSAARTNIEA